MKTESVPELNRKKVIILGGGISGLSSAFYLKKRLPSCEIQLWEKQNRIGGVLETIHLDGFQIERSADNFISDVPWGIELCRELGLIDQLAQTDSRYRRTCVVRHQKLYTLPDGFMMMAPTKLWPFAFSPLLSPFGKMRAALELFLPRKHFDDETMAHFVKRRLGTETFNRIVEPMVSGIYAGDADRLSVQATLPRFPKMEQDYRSLILAMRKRQKIGRQIVRDEQSGARYSFFVTLKKGLSHLIETLGRHLPPESIHLNRKVCSIEKSSKKEDQWLITDQNGYIERADAIISALPSQQLATLINNSAPKIGKLLGQVEHTGTAVITVGYKNEQIGVNICEMGFVVPKIEKSPIIAGSFSSHKYPHRAPPGTTLLRFFAGGARVPELVFLPDDQLLSLVLKEAEKLLKIKGEPLVVDVAKWANTMPQYYIGHLDMLHQLEQELKIFPTLAIAGNSTRGVGIPACIKSGIDAVDRIAAIF